MTLEAGVVRQIRLGRAESRVQLARELMVAPSTVGIHVDRLIDSGILRESQRAATVSGRPPQILELHPEAGQFIGIDLDARQIYGASVDFAQRLLRDRREQIRAGESAESVVRRIITVIDDVRDRHRELLGIGLAVPGTVDPAAGIALSYRFIRGWNDLPLVRQLGHHYEVPVYLENNVRAMAVAERWFGQARSVNDAICIGIRTGIGSGILLNGELFRGTDGFAGEIGRWPIAPLTADSEPASFSYELSLVLEDVASLRGMQQLLQVAIQRGAESSLELTRNRVTTDSLLKAAADNDPLTLKVLKAAAGQLGRMAAQLSLLLNPECLIVCGPLADLNSAFLKPFHAAMLTYFPNDTVQAPRILASDLGDLAGAFGAAALAVDAWVPNFSEIAAHS